jgi:hypothetical protein
MARAARRDPPGVSALVQDILAVDRVLDREIDTLTELFTDDLSRAFRKAGRAFSTRVHGLEHDAGALKPTAANTRRVFGADVTIRQMLDQAGMLDALDRGIDRYTRVIRISARASSSTPRARSVTEAFVLTKQLELQAELDGVAGKLSGLLRSAVVSGQDIGEVVYEAQEIFDAAVTRMRTLYDTSLAQLAQLVAASGEGSAPDAPFLYSGPIDLRCRNWCLQRVGRVYSKRAIDKMDNGQLPNTFLTRGGYNCRHHWRPVADQPALAKLADTGRPVQGLAGLAQQVFAQLKSLPTPRGVRRI